MELDKLVFSRYLMDYKNESYRYNAHDLGRTPIDRVVERSKSNMELKLRIIFTLYHLLTYNDYTSLMLPNTLRRILSIFGSTVHGHQT